MSKCRTRRRSEARPLTQHEDGLEHGHDGAHRDALVRRRQQVPVRRALDAPAALAVGASSAGGATSAVGGGEETQQEVTREPRARLRVLIPARRRCSTRRVL